MLPDLNDQLGVIMRPLPESLRRWHWCSRVVAIVALLLFIFSNIPVQQAMRVAVDEDPFFVNNYFHYPAEQGWPFTFEDRLTFIDTPWDCWNISQGIHQNWNWFALLCNLLVALSGSYVLGQLFEWRLRKLHRFMQVNTRDLFGIVVCIALAGAWYAHERHERDREQAVLASVQADPRATFYREGGLTWLRELSGGRAFEILDRAVYVPLMNFDRATIERLAELSELEVLDPGDVSASLLPELTRLKHLKTLDFSSVIGIDGWPLETFEFPEMSHLQALNLEAPFDPRGPIRGLNKLTSLRLIKLDECIVDVSMLRDLNCLSNLQAIYLAQVQVEPNVCAELHSLKHVQRFVLTYSALNDESLQVMSGWRDLKELVLAGTELPEGGLRHFSSLQQLELLNLADTNITKEDLVHLRKLRHLRVLDLRRVSFSQDGLEAILQLRDCQIRQ